MERVQWFQLHSGERLLSNQAGRVIRRGGGGGGAGGGLNKKTEKILAPAKSLFLRLCFKSVGER